MSLGDPYLVGVGGVNAYRVAYVIAFFLATVIDTALVWRLSAVTIALMTIPNLVGILLLHDDMKETVNKYWLTLERETGARE